VHGRRVLCAVDLPPEGGQSRARSMAHEKRNIKPTRQPHPREQQPCSLHSPLQSSMPVAVAGTQEAKEIRAPQPQHGQGHNKVKA